MARNRPDDFWQASTRIPISKTELGPGLYQIDLTTYHPAYVDLLLLFEHDSRRPLLQPFDALSPTRFSLLLKLDSGVSEGSILLSPPAGSDIIRNLTIRRLGVGAQAALAARRIPGSLSSPMRFWRKVRRVLGGAGNFPMRSVGKASRSESKAYGDWRQIFESHADQDRLRSALKATPGDGDRAGLIVFSTAMGMNGLLESFLEDFSPQLSGEGNWVCRLDLLVIEDAEAPLPPDLRMRVDSNGGAIVQQSAGQLPLPLIVSVAERNNSDFVVFLDRAGRYPEWAFDAFALEFAKNSSSGIAYGDSDRLGKDGDRLEPFFKPDWSPEFFRACNYVGSPVAFRPEMLEKSPLQSLAKPRTMSFELMLAALTSNQSFEIGHIPRVLFHEAPEEREDPSQAIRLQQEREALATQLGQALGASLLEEGSESRKRSRHLSYPLPDPPPRVSVIIPTKNNPKLLRDAADSVLDADYPSVQIVIVDNASRDPDHLRLLRELTRSDNVTVIEDPRPFNFSAMNNLGRRSSMGDVLVFLNDDAMARDPGWLRELVSLALQPDAGCVGALLLYPDGRIQHAGVMLGLSNISAHAFRGSSLAELGSEIRLVARREVSATTGACLAVRTSLFDEVGGFDERLAVSLNDVDLCLSVQKIGCRNLFTPHAMLTHHESNTLGQSLSPTQIEELTTEEAYFLRKWGLDVLQDPYYSPHLSKLREDFRLRLAG